MFRIVKLDFIIKSKLIHQDKPIAWPTFNFTPEEKKEEPKKEEPTKEETDTEKKETVLVVLVSLIVSRQLLYFLHLQLLTREELVPYVIFHIVSYAPQFSFSTQFTFNTTSSPATFSIPIPSFPAVPNLSSTGNGIFGENIAKPAAIPSPTQSPETTTSPGICCTKCC